MDGWFGERRRVPDLKTPHQRLRDEDEARIHGTEPTRSYPSPFEPDDSDAR